MAQSDLRRLFMVLPYLYPDLKVGKDWKLYDKSTGEGEQLIWLNKDITPPTDEELLNGKQGGMTQYWWKYLRNTRDKLLKESDSYILPDRPGRDAWVSYRTELRDLPTAVSPPSFEVMNNESLRDGHTRIENLMPAKPGE